jgi:GxxExxY protein
MSLLYEKETKAILRAFYSVYNELGFGFLEKVYHNAMLIELQKAGMSVESQKRIKVYYQAREIGEYFADIIVNDSVILELKAAEALVHEHELQLINYLKATCIEVGLLLNFGKQPEFRRKVFANERKKMIIKSAEIG